MKTLRFLYILILLYPTLIQGRVNMGPLQSDGMVLQQNADVKLWGWTQPNRKVSVKGSWNGKKMNTRSDDKGRFEITLRTGAGNFTPQTIEVNDGDKLIIRDVLIGEVWLCSGQSNMEMPLHGFSSCPVENSVEYIAEAGKYSGKLHLNFVSWSPAPEPADTVTAIWQDCTPLSARDFCAVGYFFGIRLVETLNVPVGIINSSLGATRVEGWTPQEIVQKYPGENLKSDAVRNCDKVKPGRNVDRSLPSVFYNGMIHPLEGYTLKGFLWYQGEANVNEPENYCERFINMVQAWRYRWKEDLIPFYYVEICPYDYFWEKDKRTVPLLREAQYKAQNLIPNMGMVCTNDLDKDYEYWAIHPCMKKEVGDRLCYWALGATYKIPGIDYRYPEYQSMEIKDDQVILTFKNAESGFNRKVGIEGFEVAGTDSVWHKASDIEVYNEDRISVKCKEVKEPVAVRYCFQSWLPGNLKGNSGLPVIPFRTDNWER